MYVFVRYSGVILVVSGALLMLVGFASALFIMLQQEAVLGGINNYLLSAGSRSVVTADVLPYLAILSLLSFLSGMITAALGQLMLVFADIGTNTRETTVLLRAMRNKGL